MIKLPSLCEYCLDVELAACADEYVILNLQASANMRAVLTDEATGRMYGVKPKDSDPDDKITISAADLPNGFFNPYKNITLLLMNSLGNQVEIVGGYRCVRLIMRRMTADDIILDQYSKINVPWAF